MASDSGVRYSVEAVFAVTMTDLRPEPNLQSALRTMQIDDEELVIHSGELGIEMQMGIQAKSSSIAVRDAVTHFRAALGSLMPEVPASLPYPIKVTATETESYFDAIQVAPIQDLDRVG